LVEIPSRPVQHRIATVLGKLDDKIELNRRMNRTMEKMAATIFKSWFIDFDPVRDKAEHRDPNLPTGIAGLFPDTFEDSDLGPIPKGWNQRPLADLIDINPKRTLAKGTRAPFLEMSNMPTQGPSPDSWRLREMGSGTKFINGDTLLARITP
jgi:type I restriction enzyme S subunit